MDVRAQRGQLSRSSFRNCDRNGQAAAAAPAGSVENTCTVKYNVVDSLISNFYYDNDSVQNDDELVFETAKGEAFDPTRITAAKADGESSLPLTVTVTKDGEVVTDYSEPGVYKVQQALLSPTISPTPER